MANRTTTICDGAGCTAEHDNPVTSRLASTHQYPGWATVHVKDEKGYACSYDLCPACVQKMTALLGLRPAEELFREQVASLNVLDVPGMEPSPPLPPPKTCGTCGEPYVGESCYFCPPPSAEPSSTEGA